MLLSYRRLLFALILLVAGLVLSYYSWKALLKVQLSYRFQDADRVARQENIDVQVVAWKAMEGMRQNGFLKRGISRQKLINLLGQPRVEGDMLVEGHKLHLLKFDDKGRTLTASLVEDRVNSYALSGSAQSGHPDAESW